MFSTAKLLSAPSAGLVLTLLSAACSGPRPAAPSASAERQVARERQLVGIGGCNDCHTPMKFDPEVGMPVPDMTRMLSGHPEGAPEAASTLAGHDLAVMADLHQLPFAVRGRAHREPHARQRDRARQLDRGDVRAGPAHRTSHGRQRTADSAAHALADSGGQTDDDLKAIFAFLRSIPAIRNDVPAPSVPDQAMDGIAAGYEKLKAKMGAGGSTHAAAPQPAGESKVAQR